MDSLLVYVDIAKTQASNAIVEEKKKRDEESQEGSSKRVTQANTKGVGNTFQSQIQHLKYKRRIHWSKRKVNHEGHHTS